MDQEIIYDVLAEVFPGKVELRPDIAMEAARAAANDVTMDLSDTDEGDPFLDPETIDLLYKSALFIAAVAKGAKDSYDLWKSISQDAKKSDERVKDLPDDTAEKLTKSTLKKKANKKQGS